MNSPPDCFTCPVDIEVDARGLRCPMPLLKAKQALRDLAPSLVLRVLATDAGSLRDFQAYATLSDIELRGHEIREGVYCYLLSKPPSPAGD